MGAQAFAERTRKALQAVGEQVRSRITETDARLTPEEAQIARLARDGLSHTEIGARLLLSPQTVEWHLRNAFTKLHVQPQ